MSFFGLRQKFLIYHMVSRSLKLRYRRSFLGYLWTILIPLMTAAIYYFLFVIVLKVPTPDFLAFVVTSIMIWTFFSGTLSEGMDSLMGNLSLLLQVNIPLNIFPLVTAVTNIVTLAFSVPVIALICYITGVKVGWPAVALIYYFPLLFVQAYCMSYMLSIFVIYLRDLRQAMGFVLQLWMYGTPILYQINQLPARYEWILYVNPIGKIFAGIHNSLLRHLWPTSAELAVPLLWTLIILAFTLFLHKRVSKKAIERI